MMKKMINKNRRKTYNFGLWKSIYNSFYLLVGFSKSYLGLSLAYKVLQGAIPAVYIMVMQRIINMVQRQEEAFSTILGYILFFVGLHVFSAIIELIYSKYNYRFKLQFSKSISMKMMQKSMDLSLSDFEDPETYDIINRAQNQSGSDILGYVMSVFDIIQQIVSIASMAYMLVKFKWQIVAVVLVIPAMRSIVTYLIDKEYYEVRTGRTSLERQRWYINFLIMTGNAFKEIKTLGIGSFLLEKYEDIQNKIIAQETRMYGKSSFSGMCFDIADWIITGGIYAYTILKGFTGVILIGDVTAYIEYTDRIKGSIESIFTGINDLVEQAMYINLLFEYFDLPVITNINRRSVEAISCIEFRNVSFKYSNGYPALKNINLRIGAGESIALIGENGSGKSTLTKLLLGLYDDYEGEILINNVDLRKINIEEYQKKIGTVFQDYVKYETSLRENIGYGDLKHLRDDEEIYDLLKAVNLDYKAVGEEGIDTVVGNWFGGQQFSIGEWQRLAIARALIKRADVYIFDEPDAALDVFRQREIVQLFKNAIKHKIGIYVSHKVSFVNELADKLIVIQNGEITEMGSHEELLSRKGYYYQLYMESLKQNRTNNDVEILGCA